MAKVSRDLLRRHRATFALLLLLGGGAILYLQGAATNPPGFFIDESSVAYNAHLIARTGHGPDRDSDNSADAVAL